MSKTLSNILTVFKVVRIIAKVIFILCTIGCVGCLFASFTLPVISDMLPAKLLAETEITSAYPACIIGAITCAGEAVIAFLAERYFKNVLNANTPYTRDGAKECFRLGIASIITSVAVSVLSGIVISVFLFASHGSSKPDVDVSISLTTGLLLLFLSLVFKHGAEIQEAAANCSVQNDEINSL